MHEAFLARTIIDIVEDSARKHGVSGITAVNVVIGKMAMVNPESLQFAFSALAGPPLFSEGVRLHIEAKDILVSCRACGQVRGLDLEAGFRCPECGSPEVEIAAGRELYVDSFELD